MLHGAGPTQLHPNDHSHVPSSDSANTEDTLPSPLRPNRYLPRDSPQSPRVIPPTPKVPFQVPSDLTDPSDGTPPCPFKRPTSHQRHLPRPPAHSFSLGHLSSCIHPHKRIYVSPCRTLRELVVVSLRTRPIVGSFTGSWRIPCGLGCLL